MKTYKTVVGKKDFKPFDAGVLPIWNWRRHEFTWKVKFHENAFYDLGKKNQADWLKGGGFTKYLSDNNKDSVMWAWRYVKKSNNIEIALYINNDNKSFIWKSAGFIELGEIFEVSLKVKRTELSNKVANYSLDGVELVITREVKEKAVTQVAQFTTDELLDTKDSKGLNYDIFDFKTVRKLGLWFGGTLPANKVLNVDIEYSKYKLKNN